MYEAGNTCNCNLIYGVASSGSWELAKHRLNCVHVPMCVLCISESATCSEVLRLLYSEPMQTALDEQAKAADAAAQRHLAFIDRLLADKESLAQQCAQQMQQLKVPP